MQTTADFRFNVFDMISALVYARAVHPCSKSKTYDEVILKLFETHNFSLDQLYSGLEYIGSKYEKVIEIYNRGYRPFHEDLPNLYNAVRYSYGQMLDRLAFLGNDYENFVEIFTVQTNNIFKLDTSKIYFDCTSFYFEIDREDVFRKKGPRKENRKEPIVGLGLLLDSNQIPLGMKMYPRNESEKPVLQDVFDQLKTFG